MPQPSPHWPFPTGFGEIERKQLWERGKCGPRPAAARKCAQKPTPRPQGLYQCQEPRTEKRSGPRTHEHVAPVMCGLPNNLSLITALTPALPRLLLPQLSARRTRLWLPSA